jgi:fatty acid synthase
MESSGMSGPKNENNLITDEIIQKYLTSDKEEHVMIKLLDSLLSLYKKDNENTTEEKEKLKKLVNEKMKEPEFDLTKDIINLISKNERFIRPLLDIVSENNVPKKELKVLEINLSNAIMAKEVDNHLASAAIYPIDIDYTLVNNSLDNLNEDLKSESFKLIEWNAKESSFPADIPTVDLLLYRDSHDLWDLKLNNYLKEVQNAIKDKGFLLTVFRYKYISPELVLNELFEENSVSDTELTKRIDEFESEAKKIDLNLICRKSDSLGSIALLFRKVLPTKEVKPKEQNVIEISSDYEKWFEILKEKLLEIKESERKEDRLWLIANDSSINGIIGLVLCLRQEPGGDKISCIFDYDMKIKLPINFSEKPFCDILKNDLAVNIIRDGVLGTYRHITLTKYDEQNETSDYYLNVGPRGELSSLQWFDAKNIASPDYFIFKDKSRSKMIRCNVYSTGLNFRDVMVASGIYY